MHHFYYQITWISWLLLSLSPTTVILILNISGIFRICITWSLGGMMWSGAKPWYRLWGLGTQNPPEI